jgi:hypothetical protein
MRCRDKKGDTLMRVTKAILTIFATAATITAVIAAFVKI